MLCFTRIEFPGATQTVDVPLATGPWLLCSFVSKYFTFHSAATPLPCKQDGDCLPLGRPLPDPLPRELGFRWTTWPFIPSVAQTGHEVGAQEMRVGLGLGHFCCPQDMLRVLGAKEADELTREKRRDEVERSLS